MVRGNVAGGGNGTAPFVLAASQQPTAELVIPIACSPIGTTAYFAAAGAGTSITWSGAATDFYLDGAWWTTD
jgi:hypothetical protein